MNKRWSLFFAGVLAAMTAVYAMDRVSHGFGKVVTASTNAQVVVVADEGGTSRYANVLSVYNSGTSAIHVAANATTGVLAQLIASTNVLTIPGGMSFYFTRDPSGYGSVAISSENGEPEVYIGAY